MPAEDQNEDTVFGKCNECKKEKECYNSTDMNCDDPDKGTWGTWLICPSCIKKTGFKKCSWCGDYRDPSTLRHHNGMCPGCEEECDEDENDSSYRKVTKKPTKKITKKPVKKVVKKPVKKTIAKSRCKK